MPVVLVIEDSFAVQQVVAVTLKQAGYEVRLVADGDSGIASVREERPDAVVLDLRLPGAHGKDVLRALKGLHPDLPVFLFTVYGDFQDKLADVADADGCFVKSGDLGPLLQAIHRAVGVERRGAPAAPGSLLRDNPALLRKLTETFLRDCPAQLGDARGAVERGLGPEIETVAHSLRGTFLTFGATRAAECARRLEVCAREGRLGEAPALFETLEDEVRRLSAFLSAMSGIRHPD